MAKPEWGIKRICPACSKIYYDLRREPPSCPSCGTVFDPEALLKSRRARPIPVEEPKKVADEAEEDIDGTDGSDSEVDDVAAEVDEDELIGDEIDEDGVVVPEEELLIGGSPDLDDESDVEDVVGLADGEKET